MSPATRDDKVAGIGVFDSVEAISGVPRHLAPNGGEIWMSLISTCPLAELSQFSGRLGGLRGPTFDLTSREGWS